MYADDIQLCMSVKNNEFTSAMLKINEGIARLYLGQNVIPWSLILPNLNL